MRRDVFQGIADPTRRAIIHMISEQPMNVNAVAGNFEVSRTAIYKHLKILAECGLVTVKQHGRERVCEAKLDKLNEVADWVGRYKQVWTIRLQSLEHYVQELQVKDKSLLKTKKHDRSKRKK